MKITLTLCLALAVHAASAQPALSWQHTYGGAADEQVMDAVQTTDGGYLLVGYTFSDDGQVSGQHGNEDLWVVKTNAAGVFIWQRALGGSASERGYAAAVTSDGGYILAGTATDQGGDVANIIGDGDIWMVKLDAAGTIDWESTYGGTNLDEPRAIVETDGGFIVAGYTESDDGQVIGYHGSGDLWVFKTSPSGALIWQNTLGGTDTDEALGMRNTSDNGVIISGSSKSSNGNLTQNFGNTDVWLVKLSDAGALQWQNGYGHTGDEYATDVLQGADGGYLFIAASNSIGGQVTQNAGNYDFWLGRANPNGVLIGETSYGGSGDDIPHALQQTIDGGFAIAGYTVSDNGSITAPLGGSDQWVVKTSDTGVLQWQRTLGGSDDEVAHAVLATDDGGYLLAGTTSSGDNDVSPERGGMDAWAVKLVGGTVGLSENEAASTTVTLFPNPATAQVWLSFELNKAAMVSYQITDHAGRVVQRAAFGRLPSGERMFTLDIGSLVAGTYTVALQFDPTTLMRTFVVLE